MTNEKTVAGVRRRRRQFLSGAAGAAAVTVAAPSVLKAQGPISMRWQSTWPAKDIFHEYAQDFAKKVNDMTGGELVIEVLPAGAVVPAFGLLDAVSQGTLDGGHGVLAYHYGKQPALDRGLLDGAEFNNATSDRILGFPDVSKVCMLQSYHQSAETFEISFNKTKFDALPAKMKAIIDNAVEAASSDLSWKAIDRYSKDYVELQSKDKVKFYKTPDTVLQAQLKVWSTIVEKKSAENPLFKEIAESQKGFAERVVKWDQDTNISRRMSVNHFFGAKKA
ncbi:MAG TPA: hypothetical protein VIV84_03995 [Burkholderiaceae bacterium]